jgi:2-hydroxychromene-2-carboxylate isomerase
MPKTIDYFFTPVSPWTYFGHTRFVAIAAKHGATIVPKLMDLAPVFAVSGGLPLAKRPPQRLAYRIAELTRWREYLGIPLNVQPKFFASSGETGTKWILAAVERSVPKGLDLAFAIMRARWAEDRDIADEATLAAIATSLGQDAKALAARAEDPEIAARHAAMTQEAIDRQVFGAPTYIYRDELFWGQDRLDFLDRALAK